MPSKFDIFRDRLAYAKRVWVEKGLMGSGGPSRMRQLIDFYRSNQWVNAPDWSGLNEDDLMVVNKIFPMANAQQGEIAARNPRVQYFARTKESRQNAPIVQALHNYDIIESNHIAQHNAAFRDHQFAPLGVIRHGYTPPEEVETEKGRRLDFYRPATGTLPWIRRIPIWDCLIDPDCETFLMDGGAKWCAFRSIMTTEQIKSNPNMVAKRNLEKVAGQIPKDMREQLPPEKRRGLMNPDEDKFVEVWTVYEMEERTWFQMTLDGLDGFLREPDDWPIPWEWLPINAFAVNNQMDTPFALSILEEAAPLQVELNKLRTMLSLFAKNIRRQIGVQSEGMEEEEFNKLANGMLVEYFRTTGRPSEVVSEMRAQGIDQGLLLYNAQIEEDFRETLGQSRMARGQRINVETATEASFVQTGQDVNTARISDAFHRFVQDTEKLYMQGRRFLLQESGIGEVIRVVDVEQSRALEEWINVGPEEIAGEFDFEVVAGSTRRKDRAQEAAVAGAQLQVASSLPQIFNIAFYAEKWARLSGDDPAKALTPQAQQAAAIEGAAAVANTVRGAVTGDGANGSGLDPNIALALTGGGGQGEGETPQ